MLTVKELERHVAVMIEPKMLINGIAHTADRYFPVINPATEEVIGNAPEATRADLDAATTAARAAFPAWRARPITERQALVADLSGTLAEHVEDLSKLLTAEQGRPIAFARQEILGGVAWLKAISTIAPETQVIEDSAERRVEIRHVPLGVVGAISPWNYPVLLALWKVAPALVTGNCVVLKPSPFTPLETLRIGELVRDVLPAGVFNIVTGGDHLGPWMTEHPAFDKISFTGSSATGRKVMASAAATLKRVTLELGGNDAAIVMPDVDLETAVPQLFWAAFANSGQICIAAKRIYVHEEVYDRFSAAFVAFSKQVKMGDGTAEDVQMGPVQNAAQYARVQALVDDCRAHGLTFLTGDEPVRSNSGYFIPITIIDNPPENSRIVIEEPFGPIVPLLRFRDVDDVITRANNSPYGLAASIWSRDIVAATAIAERLDSGIVWINEAQYLSPFLPFGGHKQSGMGVENGLAGMLEYTNIQAITVKKN